MQHVGDEDDIKIEDDEEIHNVKFKRSISKSINEFVKSKHERRTSTILISIELLHFPMRHTH